LRLSPWCLFLKLIGFLLLKLFLLGGQHQFKVAAAKLAPTASQMHWRKFSGPASSGERALGLKLTGQMRLPVVL
jgi:hypothetical protein